MTDTWAVIRWIGFGNGHSSLTSLFLDDNLQEGPRYLKHARLQYACDGGPQNQKTETYVYVG